MLTVHLKGVVVCALRFDGGVAEKRTYMLVNAWGFIVTLVANALKFLVIVSSAMITVSAIAGSSLLFFDAALLRNVLVSVSYSHGDVTLEMTGGLELERVEEGKEKKRKASNKIDELVFA